MKPGDTVTLSTKHALRNTSFVPPAFEGKATIIASIGPMRRVAFHGWITDRAGRQLLPWFHEADLES